MEFQEKLASLAAKIRQQKYLGTFDADKNETRHLIDALDDIFEFADILKDTAKSYAC